MCALHIVLHTKQCQLSVFPPWCTPEFSNNTFHNTLGGVLQQTTLGQVGQLEGRDVGRQAARHKKTATFMRALSKHGKASRVGPWRVNSSSSSSDAVKLFRACALQTGSTYIVVSGVSRPLVQLAPPLLVEPIWSVANVCQRAPRRAAHIPST